MKGSSRGRRCIAGKDRRSVKGCNEANGLGSQRFFTACESTPRPLSGEADANGGGKSLKVVVDRKKKSASAGRRVFVLCTCRISDSEK